MLSFLLSLSEKHALTVTAILFQWEVDLALQEVQAAGAVISTVRQAWKLSLLLLI